MTIENYQYLQGEEEGEEGGEQFSTYDGGAGASPIPNVGRAIIYDKGGPETRKKNSPGSVTQFGRNAKSATRRALTFFNPSKPIKDAAVSLSGLKQRAIKNANEIGRLIPLKDVPKEFDVNIPDDKKQRTTFESNFKKVLLYFFTQKQDTDIKPFVDEYKIRTLRALANIKLYQTKKCLAGFFSTLEECIDDAFIHGKNNSMRGVDKSKLVEVQLKDNIRKQLDDNLIVSITAPILDVNYTMKLHKNIGGGGEGAGLSFIYYILQLCVIYYYPKYLLDFISNIIQQIFTSIYTDYTKLTNGDNSNIKQILSNLIASINDQNDAGPIQAELTTHIDTYIKGINLQDDYSLNSRKVFFNALVNFAISISMYANHEVIENKIASRIYNGLKILLEIKDDDDPNILASLKVDIETKRGRLAELRATFDPLNKYFEDKEFLEGKEAKLKQSKEAPQSSGNLDITDLEKTVKHLRTSLAKEKKELDDADTPIAINYNDIVRLQEEIKILEDDGPSILKAVNEDKRKWVTQDYIEGIINDIWQTSPAGSNYKDEIFKHITQAVQSSSMFEFNVELKTPDQATTTPATTTQARAADRLELLGPPAPEPDPQAPAVLVGDPLDPATMAHNAAMGADSAMSAVIRAQEERAAEEERRRREEAAAKTLARIRLDPNRNAMAAQAPVAAQAQEANAANWEAARENLIQRQAAATRERVAKEAARKGDGGFDLFGWRGLSVGGKRRTRRHKKRAGTRRYKKRAGTRRHKKRKNTTR